MAFVEIYPDNKSDVKYDEECFKWHENYNSCVKWHKDGNEIVVVLNTDTNVGAVYERLGNVLCLDDRFDVYCVVDCDDDRMGYNAIIRQMLVNEAIADGFPEKCPCPKDEPKKFYVNVSMGTSTSFCIEAEDKYEALDKAEHLMWSRPFFDALIENIDFRDKGSLDMLYDSMRVVDVDECTDPDVDPLCVDGFLK
jgi:hypothetical protein